MDFSFKLQNMPEIWRTDTALTGVEADEVQVSKLLQTPGCQSK